MYSRDFSYTDPDSAPKKEQRENGFIRQKDGDYIKSKSKNTEKAAGLFQKEPSKSPVLDFSFLKNISLDDILLAAIGFLLVFGSENESDLLIILIALLLLT